MYKCVIFDLDGTIYFGNQLAQKANEVINKAREKFLHIFFVTNNSAKSREQIYKKLKSLGVDLTQDELYTVSYIIPKYLKEHDYKEVYCIGTDSLCSEISNAGIKYKSKKPEAVVVGFNPDFKLSDLDELANINVDNNCKIIIANRERTYPVDKGYINAGAGPIVSAVECLLNKKVDVVTGKPNVQMLKVVTSGLNISPNEILVIGDSYNSDIRMAQDFGAKGILITNNPVNDCQCIEKLSDLLEMWND